jgi:ComF family protein
VCLETPLRARPIRAAFLFEGPLREVLHAFKYRGGLGVVETLLSSLVRVWREQGMNADFLLPVPLHPARERRRGYNQAEVLALALGRGLGLPVARRGLRRVRNTPSQTRLDRAERRANVSGAFALDEGLSVADRRVALIDDVATTGATLDACAVVLLEAGAAQVSAFTLARAP